MGSILNLIDLHALCSSNSSKIDTTVTATTTTTNDNSECKDDEVLKKVCEDYTNQWARLLYNTSTNDLDRRNLPDSFAHLYIDKATFVNFFSDVSFEIISDTKFERLMRNLWHLSGGNGSSANTSCTMLEVLHTSGRVTR